MKKKTNKQRIKRNQQNQHVNTHAAFVDAEVYPAMVFSTMGIHAAIGMKAIVTAVECTESDELLYGITAKWLSDRIHYSIAECVSMLEAFESMGYITKMYEYTSDKNDTRPVDFDTTLTRVYKCERIVCVVDTDAPTSETGVPCGKAILLSTPKDLAVFVANKRSVRIVNRVIQPLKRRGLVRLVA